MKQNLLLCALLGILCVQVFVKPVSCKMIRKLGNDSDSDNDDDDEDTDNDTDSDDASDDSDEEEYQDPSEELNCILFDTSACNATCNMLGYLYGTDGEGTCDQELSCDCKIKQESDLTTLWDAKIQKDESSSQILSKINKDSDLSSRAIKTLQKFPRTNAQLLDEIKNEFSDIEGIDKLKILQDTSPVKKFIDDNDKVNEAELRTHISNVIQQALKDKKFTIGDPKYKAKLTKFFNNNIEDEVKEYIRDQVLKTDNAALKKLLTTGNTQNKYDFEFDKYASYDRIVDFVEAVVNDEFVKFVEASTKPSPRRTKSSRLKRPTAATRPARPPTPTRPSSIAPKTSKKSESSTQSDKANQWDTPIKILNVISKMRGEGHKEMSDGGVNVEFERDIVGNISLRWKNGNNEVHFDKDMNGAIEQLWKFGNVTISLSRDMNGTLTEDWLLGQTEMKHYKSFMGHSNTSWIEDKEDSKSLEKYRKFIDSWCDKNYTLVKTRDCKIYDRNAY